MRMVMTFTRLEITAWLARHSKVAYSLLLGRGNNGSMR